MINAEEVKVNSGAGAVMLRSLDGNVEVFYASSLSNLNRIRVEF